MTGSATAPRSHPFVDAHLQGATDLGVALADAYTDPERFAAMLTAGFSRLADPAYRSGQHRVAPGIGPTYGVRTPLLERVATAFLRETREDRPGPLLYVCDRLYRESHLEARWFAFALLGRTLASDPERSWQLLRRAAREAGDWITVDTLARPYATGILAEPYRWAELEQLVFSPSPWERRLVGSVVAALPHGRRDPGRDAEIVGRALPILGSLIGDAAPEVQKALSWAYRSLIPLDREAVTAALASEAERAATDDDGHRAWVVRDSLPKLDPRTAARLRDRLEGIRRRPGAPSSSSAADIAQRFGGLPDPARHPEPPLA
jgi:3-methyladenine DNA glycosylase AlkD